MIQSKKVLRSQAEEGEESDPGEPEPSGRKKRAAVFLAAKKSRFQLFWILPKILVTELLWSKWKVKSLLFISGQILGKMNSRGDNREEKEKKKYDKRRKRQEKGENLTPICLAKQPEYPATTLCIVS